MLYQQDYPDTAMQDQSAPTAARRRTPSASAMAPWLHGRGQAGQLALAASLGSDRLCAADGDL